MRSCDALVEAAADVAASSTPEGRLLRLAALRQAVDAAMVSALADIEASPGAVRLDGGIDGGQWLAARSDLHPAGPTRWPTCDATIRGMVVNGPSEILDLGRSQRLGTPGQRRAASVRDGGCVYPGCDRPPEECDLHHIRHWLKHRGPTDLANLCLLCRRHHTLTHAIGFTFQRRADGFLMIYRPDGTPLVNPGQRAA